MAVEESRLLISIDARNAETQARLISNELQNITNSGTRADRQVSVLGGSLKSLAGYMAGVVSVGAAISKMDAYTNIQNRLKLVTANQQELNTAMKDTFAIAQGTAQSWDSVVQVYQRFSDNAKTLKLNMQDVAGVTETVSKAVAVSGASAASAEAALTQLGQSIASGVFRGEEFNSVAEQTPALLKAIASGLGVNIGQLRGMAAEGKITADVLIKGLQNSKESVDALFSKTDFSVAASFTQLNNAVTEFVGEAGKANGAASFLSDSIRALALNLDSVANVAVLGGVALLTKTILAQTVAMKAAIGASVARRATLLSELQAQAQVTATEVARTGALAQNTAMHLANAQAAGSRLVGMQRLAYLQSTLLPLERANTQAVAAHAAATAADTAVQNANNAARSRAAMLFGAVGGTVGVLTIGVTALAAGYMYMQSRAAKANAELERQADVANKATTELAALAGIEKDKSIVDLTTALKAQNEALTESSSTINMQLTAIKRLYAGNAEVVKVVEDAKNGTISMTEATSRFNKLRINKEIYESFQKNSDALEENTTKATKTQSALKILGVEVTITGNKAQNAVNNIKDLTNATEDNEVATNAASAAQQKFQQSLANRKYYAEYKRNLVEVHGMTVEQSEELAKLQEASGGAGKPIPKGSAKKTLEVLAAEQRFEAIKKARDKAESDANKSNRRQESDAKKHQKEIERQNQENLRLSAEDAESRLDITYRYSSKRKQLEIDLEKEVAEIRKARFNPTDEAKFIDEAKARANAELRIYNLQEDEKMLSYTMNEEQKLYQSYKIQKLILENAKYSNDEIKKDTLKNLNIEFKQNLANAQLAKEQRIFQAEEGLMKESEAITKRYELERREIMKTLDAEERSRKLLASYRNEDVDQEEVRRNVDQKYKERFNIDQESPYQQDLKLLKDTLEQKLITEEQYFQKRSQLQMIYGAQYGASFAGMLKGLVDENSNAYAALGAAQKAFTLFSVAMSSYDAITKAWASAPFPYNLPAVASATMETGLLQAAVSALSPAGFKTGGYTGNVGVNDVAGVVHGQEYVFDAKSTSRVGTDTLDAIRSGQPVALNGATQQSNVNVPVTIVNQFDDATIADAIKSDAGQKAIINVIKRNSTTISGMI